MASFVALLRGINVGGRRIAMADLQPCIESLGFKQVRTILQTGNVVFETQNTHIDSLKTQIEAALTNQFGYPAIVLIYSIDMVQSIRKNYPFGIDPSFQHYVIFLSKNNRFSDPIAAFNTDPSTEELAPGQDCLYWKVKKGVSLQSTFAKRLTKSDIRDFNTVRNLNTVDRVLGS